MTIVGTKKDLVALAEKLGAEIDWGVTMFNVDAPVGMVWNASGASTIPIVITAAGTRPQKGDTASAYGEAIRLMQMGVSPAPLGYEGWWGIMTENGVEEV